MIKRFLPIQDTFIFGTVKDSIALSGSVGDTISAGKDEILEIGNSSYSDMFTTYVSRMLVEFDMSEVEKAVAGVENYTAKLHYYLADSRGLPEKYTIDYSSPVEAWEAGTGKSCDNTGEVFGATWKYRDEDLSEWTVPGAGNKGTIYSASFTCVPVRQDLSLDVTEIVSNWISQENLRLVISLHDEEKLAERGTELRYYSSDTHTIYKPYLEIGYNDTVYSSSLATLNNSDIKTTVVGLKEYYRWGDTVQFRVKSCPLFPDRVFSTSSLYRNDYILPEDCFWGIKDEYTNEMVVDFSDYTKLSADDKGNYFNFDTSILEPERYYRLLFSVQFDGFNTTLDNKDIFKVVRNGKL